MEFWNSLLTEKSWKLLQKLRKEYNFILIGGWAVYLLAKQQKSKDIDIVVDILELQKLKKENLSKNDSLKKYEIKLEETDIDIYVSHFSKLPIPPEELKKYAVKVEGFNVASPEALLILKQGAEYNRENSVKGEKDKLDILSILFFSDFDFRKYKMLLSKYSLIGYIDRLISLLRNFRDYDSLGFSPRELKLKKEEILAILRTL